MDLLLDPEDEHLRPQLRLHNANGWYVRIGSKRLHRLLTNAPSGSVVDHKNGNPLDNRKANLRVTNHTVNARNTKLARTNSSGYQGVGFDKATGLWMARIRVDGKLRFLGRFACPQQANLARLRKEKELWGIHPQRRQAFIDAGVSIE